MTELKYGLLIKVNRKQQKLSVRSLARMSGVDFSYLAKIERAQTTCHETVITSILKELKITNEGIFQYDQRVKENFDMIYNSLVYQIKDTKSLLGELRCIENELKKSLMYIDYILIVYIYNVANGISDENQIESENFLKENVDFLLAKKKALFFDYLSLRFYYDGNIQQAVHYSEKAWLIHSDGIVQAMIGYHMGMYLANKGEIIEALDYYRKAKALFDEDGNMIRSFHCQMAVANAFSLLGKNKKAIALYEHLELISEQLILKNGDKSLLYTNLSWFCLLENNYLSSIYYNEIAIKYDKSLVNYLYFVWSYLSLIKKAKCLSWIENYKENINKLDCECVEHNLIFAVEKWIQEDFNEHDILGLLKQAKEENSKKMVEFLYKIVIEFYTRNNQFVKLSQIYFEYVNYLKIEL